MNDQETIIINGATLIRPKSADQALRIANRYRQSAAEWEEGSGEKNHCEIVATEFEKLAKELS